LTLELLASLALEPVSVLDCHGPDTVNCKNNEIRAAWSAGNRIGALRIAGRFFDRSIDTIIFKRGIDAFNNPNFYRQLGKDPEQLMAAALELLAKKFRL
jgi:hypothetical protein